MGLTYNDLKTRPWTRGDFSSALDDTPVQVVAGTVVESHEAGSTNNAFDTTTGVAYAQGFKVDRDTVVNGLAFMLDAGAGGGTTADVQAMIQTDNGAGLPSGTGVTGAGKTDFSIINKSELIAIGHQWYYFGLATAVTLKEGVQYHAVCIDDDPQTFLSDQVAILSDAAGTYADGHASSSPTDETTGWVTMGAGVDLQFRVYEKPKQGFRVMGCDVSDGELRTISIYDGVGAVGTPMVLLAVAAATSTIRLDPNGRKFENGIYVTSSASTAIDNAFTLHIEG